MSRGKRNVIKLIEFTLPGTNTRFAPTLDIGRGEPCVRPRSILKAITRHTSL